MLNWLIEFGVIFAACCCAEGIFFWFDNKKKPEVQNCLCDICHRPRKTKLTFDKKLWVCRRCNDVYRYENK